MKKYNVAVIGATGNVGREILNSLSQRSFPVNKIFAAASLDSLGKSVSFGDNTIKVCQISDLDFSDLDFAFFVQVQKYQSNMRK